MSHTDSVAIQFRQSKWNLDLNRGNNAAALDNIDRKLTTVLNDSIYRLRHVSILGGASPEGSVEFNKLLSENRAATLFSWFDKYNQLSDLDKSFTYYGRDWEGVLRLAENDSNIPYRDETLALLRTIVDEKRILQGEEPARSLERMKQLRNGEPYRYLYRNIFPTVRASKVIINYDHVIAPDHIPAIPIPHFIPELKTDIAVNIEPIIISMPRLEPKKPFYMALYSNMLFDAALVPNLGVEFYLGKNWSIAANYIHAWWSKDAKHRYWRIYGGDINVRYWFGKQAHQKPLTGHHIGAYVQALTYDFEWGGKAYMAGEPGGTIFDRAHIGGGIEYGYSLPIAKRLNIDFSLGVGYIGGRVYEFEPDGDRYLWTATKNKHWFGPTKLEISLVWLLGRGNTNAKYNKEKGGEL